MRLGERRARAALPRATDAVVPVRDPCAVAAARGKHQLELRPAAAARAPQPRRRRGAQHRMGLAERIEAHQNQKEEEDRPLTEDEELAKRMAERSWAERQEEPEGL